MATPLHQRRIVVAGAMVTAAGLVFAACSGGDSRLSDHLVAPTRAGVAQRSAAASVQLTEADVACVADGVSDDDAQQMLALGDEPLSPALADRVAKRIMSCGESEALVRSAVEPFVADAPDDEVDCVADRIGDHFTIALIASRLAGSSVPGPFVELELASALGLCLEPDALLEHF